VAREAVWLAKPWGTLLEYFTNDKYRFIHPTSNLSSNESRSRSSIFLVVQVGRCDRSTTLANVVTRVAYREGFGACDGAEGLAALRVAKDNNCAC
jgi:hypothetical protein